MAAALWSLVVMLVACGGDDVVTPTTVDADGDGYDVDTDCNDNDDSVFPGADERCNQRDDDCDGAVDEDAVDMIQGWVDADADGYGGGEPVLACALPDGHSIRNGDCDDGDDEVHPDAEEFCDGVDNDCDDRVDVGAVDAQSWYRDGDRDGFGAGDALIACDPPSTHVGNADDCRDDDAAIHPDADEVCDRIDNDCDGRADDSSAIDQRRFYKDTDGDGWGDSDVSVLSCSAPTGYAFKGGDCDERDTGINPGVPEDCGDGIDNDCDGIIDGACELSLDDADATWVGEAALDFAGRSLSAGGDFDGDGQLDFATGAHGLADAAGRAYLLLGPPATAGEGLLADADVQISGEAQFSYFGMTLDLGPDVTGDGYGDLAVGAYGTDRGDDADAGGIWLYSGPDGGALGQGDADASVLGELAESGLGRYLVHSGRDLDHDGHGDLLTGLPGVTDTLSSSGLLALFAGPLSGSLTLADASAVISASGPGQLIGRTATTGDIDGDGLLDLVYGMADNHGVRVVLGPLSGSRDSDDADGFVYGEAGALLGSAVLLGDFDGDGTQDLAAGAEGDAAGGLSAGAWVVYPGPLTATLASDDAVFSVHELSHGRMLGSSNSGADVGDSNGDGLDDLLLGSAYNGFTGTRAGAAFLFEGPLVGTYTVGEAGNILLGTAASDGAGAGVLLWDVDDDGLDDAMVSSPGWGGDLGRIQLVLGAGL